MFKILIISFSINIVLFFNTTFAISEQATINSKAVSLGNSVTANPPSHLSIHYNPAGLSSMREGIVMSYGLVLENSRKTVSFTPDSSFVLMKNISKSIPGVSVMNDPVANTEAASTKQRLMPIGSKPFDTPVLCLPLPLAISYRPRGSKWTFTNGIYMPYEKSFVYDSESTARFQAESFYFQHLIYASPSFAYQMNERFSVGLSLGLGQTAYGSRSSVRMPNETIAQSQEIAKSTSSYPASLYPFLGGGIGAFDEFATMDIAAKNNTNPSLNLGILWQPLEFLTVGVAYQSPIKRNLTGSYDIVYSDKFLKVSKWTLQHKNYVPKAVPGLSNLSEMQTTEEHGKAEMINFIIPQTIKVGFKLKPIDKCYLMYDFHWTNWSSVKDRSIVYDRDIQVLKVAKLLGYSSPANRYVYPDKYRDTFDLSFGIEYFLKESLALRIGYENRMSNVKDSDLDLLSSPNTHILGMGIGMKFPNRFELDLGIGYIYKPDIEILSEQSSSINSKKLSSVYTPYAGHNIHMRESSYIVSLNVSVPIFAK